ncbi:MAG: type II toxin-antitoxin system RelE/ParE family toxin [Rhizomicrobium sp.]
MTHRLRLLQSARTEINEAAEWYETQTEGMGPEFLRDFDIVAERLKRYPEAYQIARGTVRRAPMGRFPYNIYYRLYGDEIVMLACVHQKRDPSYWLSRV